MKQPTKDSNPKEAFGDAKVPMDLIPDSAIIEENLAFLEGALKYGGYNYRVVGVKVSTYVRAARRHLAKFWNGQDRDPLTRVMELASVRACCGILIDGILKGNITDDRPPRAEIERQLKDAEAVVAHLKQLFKDHNPPQYTEREYGDAARKMIDRAIVPAGTLACNGCGKPDDECEQYEACVIVRRYAAAKRGEPAPANVGTGIAPQCRELESCVKPNGHAGAHLVESRPRR